MNPVASSRLLWGDAVASVGNTCDGTPVCFPSCWLHSMRCSDLTCGKPGGSGVDTAGSQVNLSWHPELLPGLQVGRVLTVEEFESEKLYKLQIEVGGGETRQVGSPSYVTQCIV